MTGNYYLNVIAEKAYYTKDECYEDMSAMQTDGTKMLIDAMKKYIADVRKTNPEIEAVLSTGLQYIIDCVDYTQEVEDSEDNEDLTARLFDSHIDDSIDYEDFRYYRPEEEDDDQY